MSSPVRSIAEALAETLGRGVRSLSPEHGGDVDRALRVTLEGGERVFVKVARDGRSDRMVAEARGLRFLAAAGAVHVPVPLAVLDDPPALVLPWLERGRSTPASEERLGRELAALHRAGAPSFGAEAPGFLATLPLDPTPRPTWARFYAEARLVPLARLADERGAIETGLRRRVERLADDLEAYVGPPEPPARLHGDLWGGNALVDADGTPWIFDPSAFGGHREIDLGMMRLFGGFSARTFDAYAEAFPLAPGHEERVPLAQLLPLLAHAALFGGSWAGQVSSALSALGA